MKNWNPILKFILFFIISFRVFSDSTFGLEIKNIVWYRLAFYVVIVFFALVFSRIRREILKTLRPVLFMMLFVAVFRLIPVFYEIFSGNNFSELEYSDLFEALLYAGRFFTASFAALVFFGTTSHLQILEAFDSVENAAAKVIPCVKKLHVAQIFSITLSFIPAIFSNWNKITLSAKARCPAKNNPAIFLRCLNAEFTALFCNMIDYAEKTRKAVENRN